MQQMVCYASCLMQVQRRQASRRQCFRDKQAVPQALAFSSIVFHAFERPSNWKLFNVWFIIVVNLPQILSFFPCCPNRVAASGSLGCQGEVNQGDFYCFYSYTYFLYCAGCQLYISFLGAPRQKRSVIILLLGQMLYI